MYYQPKDDHLTTLFEYWWDAPSDKINFQEVISQLAPHRSEYKLESYLNNKLHGTPARMKHGSSGWISDHNNGNLHGIYQTWSNEGQTHESTVYSFNELKHGLVGDGYEVSEYFFGRLLCERKFNHTKYETRTIYDQDSNSVKSYLIPNTGFLD